MSRQHLIRYLLGLLVLLVLLGHATRRYELPWVSGLERQLYDTRVRITMPGTQDARVVILDIDERSLARFGRWPWSRDHLATLVTKLFDEYRVTLVGFDVVFAEADHSSGLRQLQQLARTSLKNDAPFQRSVAQLTPQLDYDRRFADAIRDRPVVLGYYLNIEGQSSGTLPPPVLPAGSLGERRIAITSWDSHGGNLAQFQDAAWSGGHFNQLPDADGAVRRVPMLAQYQGAYYDAFALAMVRAVLGNADVVPGFGEGGDAYAAIEWLDLMTPRGALRVPVDANVAALVPYRGERNSFPYYSIADVMDGSVKPEQLRNKIVLVGTTAPGLRDERATPVGETYPGVEVHANLITGMLDGRILQAPKFVIAAEAGVLLLLGLAMIFAVPWGVPARAGAWTLVILVLVPGLNLLLWQQAGWVMPLAASLLLVTLLFVLNMSLGYLVEARAKRQFTKLFGQYVPPELVEQMSRDPGRYSMAGRRADLTVLFSDIRGFTSISESMPPDRLASLMNDYLGAMTAVVQQQRGTLDKYIGDAIMAFWGAPVEQPQHAQLAIETALGMQAALRGFNASLVARGDTPIAIGIGLNTGSMTVGDMGSVVRKAYTVLGDAVNLAARLEGLTKEYGVGILVGEATRAAVTGIVFRELDRVQVKGKEQPVAIYEPLGTEADVDNVAREELHQWEQALAAYRARDWASAETRLLSLQRAAPECRLYAMYLVRLGMVRHATLPDDWNGVTRFETK